jgi:hypothetical protein
VRKIKTQHLEDKMTEFADRTAMAFNVGTAAYVGYQLYTQAAPAVVVATSVALTALAFYGVQIGLERLQARLLTPKDLHLSIDNLWKKDYCRETSSLMASAIAFKLVQVALPYFTKVVLPAVPNFFVAAAVLGAVAALYFRKQVGELNAELANVVTKLNGVLSKADSSVTDWSRIGAILKVLALSSTLSFGVESTTGTDKEPKKVTLFVFPEETSLKAPLAVSTGSSGDKYTLFASVAN